MRLQGVREHQNVIKIDKTKQKFSKDPVYHPLEGLGRVPEAKREAEELKESKGSDDGGFGDVGRSHGRLKITLLDIKFGTEPGTGDSGGEFGNSR